MAAWLPTGSARALIARVRSLLAIATVLLAALALLCLSRGGASAAGVALVACLAALAVLCAALNCALGAFIISLEADLRSAAAAIRALPGDGSISREAHLSDVEGVRQAIDGARADIAAGIAGATHQRAQDRATIARLRRVASFARDLATHTDVEGVLEHLCDVAVSLTGARGARVWAIDDFAKTLTLMRDSSLSPLAPPSQPPWSPGEVERVARATEMTRIHALGAPDAHDYAVPLTAGVQGIAILELVGTDGLSGDVQRTVEALSAPAAAALIATQLRRDIEQRGETDILTRLPNRRRLDSDLRRECALRSRHGRTFAYVMLDVDHFKSFNDTYGHQVGDDVLRDVGRTLTTAIRDSDTAYRYGGEEFALLLRGTALEGATELTERVRRAVQAQFADAGAIGPVTISLGVTEHSPGDTPADLIARADAALYAAKKGGRNRVEVTPPPAFAILDGWSQDPRPS